MEVKVMPGSLRGTVNAIPSKSQAHRALICAALADGATHIACKGSSDDIAATEACLAALGAELTRDGDGFWVKPLKGQKEENGGNGGKADRPVMLPCGESGSTLRFLLPIVGALGLDAAFAPRGRLPERPLSPLYEELTRHGCTLSPQGAVPFLSSGQLTPGIYTLDAGVSSQFISGLLFALPLLEGDSALQMTGQVESFPYIEMTMAMLALFGIDLGFQRDSFAIRGRQAYRSPGIVRVEGDWSNAAFWLAAGAIGAGAAGAAAGAGDTAGAADAAGAAVATETVAAKAGAAGAADAAGAGHGVTCTGLDSLSPQGDKLILDILARFGARVETHDGTATVSPGILRGIDIDAGDIPDLVPILAVVGAVAEGDTVIRNASRLRTKESDRLAAMTAALSALGAMIEETEDGLHICGGAPLSGGPVSSFGDHRIAMAAAVAATVCAGPVLIHGAEAVNKSYPGFFDDLRLLGGILG